MLYNNTVTYYIVVATRLNKSGPKNARMYLTQRIKGYVWGDRKMSAAPFYDKASAKRAAVKYNGNVVELTKEVTVRESKTPVFKNSKNTALSSRKTKFTVKIAH